MIHSIKMTMFSHQNWDEMKWKGPKITLLSGTVNNLTLCPTKSNCSHSDIVFLNQKFNSLVLIMWVPTSQFLESFQEKRCFLFKSETPLNSVIAFLFANPGTWPCPYPLLLNLQNHFQNGRKINLNLNYFPADLSFVSG